MVALLLGATLMSSCVGSFALFNKLAKWNKHATKSKFLNEIIFLVISPAYAFCSAADALVLNSIEFWTGNNPVANRVGKTRNIKGDDGLIYAVKYLENGYQITKPDGSVFYFTYNKQENTWYMNAEGKEQKIIHFNGDGSVKAFLNNGWYKLLHGKKIRFILATLQYQIGAQACPYFCFYKEFQQSYKAFYAVLISITH